MTRNDLVVLAAEAGEEGGTFWLAYGIGIGFFLFLIALVVGLVAFGGGREHS